MLPKPERKVDFELLGKIRLQGCAICGRKADASHIRSRGSGGPDADWNVFPKCRTHHIEWGLSYTKFLRRYPAFAWTLESRGWMWGDRSPTGKLWHPKLGPEPGVDESEES